MHIADSQGAPTKKMLLLAEILEKFKSHYFFFYPCLKDSLKQCLCNRTEAYLDGNLIDSLVLLNKTS